MADLEQRESWGSRWGLILAAAGNAVGIGNLLRFPAQAAQNGGGAFMIPYVVSLLLFGLPMMWIAWTIGRHGGRFGHGSTPGMFDRMWSHPVAKYLGVIGLALPLLFCLYYTYIESWCLGYAWFSLTGDYVSSAGHTVDLRTYLGEFLGNTTTTSYFPGFNATIVFAVVTVLLNIWILYRGVARGIELLAKIAMPALFLFCLVLVVRMFSLGEAEGSIWDGLAFLWTPNFGALSSPKVWIAAAGQIFFTLSIGFGTLECYASYLKDNDDVALSGLTTVAANEFVEVIFGSLIAIPACALFFGADQVPEIAASGNFSIGMVSMPEVLRSFPGVEFFGTIWFLLLFFAAFTSSVGVAQPVIAFFEDEAKLPRPAAAALVGLMWILGTIPIIFFYRYGVLDELDFWAGTLGLVVFALIESVLFSWIFGIKRGWNELHRGALIRVPRVFRYVMQYVTPVLLAVVFCWWFVEAIANDLLLPKPRVDYAVAEVGTFPGRFSTGPALVSPDPDPAGDARSAEQYRAAIAGRVEEVEHDLFGWADGVIDPDGRIRVRSFGGDPALGSVLDAGALERWLGLEGFRYRPHPGEDCAATDGELRAVRVQVEAWNRAPYIWLVRIIMIGVILAFLVITHAVWRRRSRLRREEAANAGSVPAEAEVPS
ncbi:MAG: sodium-dependent transporter [Deltaproteobacteria bacterium]|nr:sodium-dependent transporter [Deltaproteobacteria bacterium]